MERILITGGLGHIGSGLIRFLSDYDLTVCDNLSTQRYCSLFNLEKNIRFVDHSFMDLDKSFLDKFDAVIHLAAITDAASSFRDPKWVWKVNVEQTCKFLTKVEHSKVKTVIFPSSTSVYGTSDKLVNEDKKYVNAQSPYAETKVWVEDWINENLQETKYIILRLGTIYGISNGMRFHTAINKFCYQAAFNKPLSVWKQNYHHYRPYLCLSDLCSLMRHILDEELVYNQTYNVLTDNHKLSEIVEQIKKYVSHLDVEFVDTPLLNQHSYKVSNKKLLELTEWRPCGKGENAIAETLELLGYEDINYRRRRKAGKKNNSVKP